MTVSRASANVGQPRFIRGSWSALDSLRYWKAMSRASANDTYGYVPTPRSVLFPRTVPRQNQYLDPEGRTVRIRPWSLSEVPISTTVMGCYRTAWNAVGPKDRKREGYF